MLLKEDDQRQGGVMRPNAKSKPGYPLEVEYFPITSNLKVFYSSYTLVSCLIMTTVRCTVIEKQ